jgi:hypothetical protein
MRPDWTIEECQKRSLEAFAYGALSPGEPRDTQGRADELCDLLHEGFRPLIEEGVLLVERHDWSVCEVG